MSRAVASHPHRNYASLLNSFPREPYPIAAPLRKARMQQVADALWDLLGSRGVSWLGFYLKHPTKDEMTLGPRRDKPACSPIGLHGMCGRGWRDQSPIIIRDVVTLGKNYIACDPKDQSELVIPLFESGGECWGVFDADSYETGSFDTADVVGMTALLEHTGLSAPRAAEPQILRL